MAATNLGTRHFSIKDNLIRKNKNWPVLKKCSNMVVSCSTKVITQVSTNDMNPENSVNLFSYKEECSVTFSTKVYFC